MRSFVTIILVETPDGFSNQFDDDGSSFTSLKFGP